MDSLRGEPGDDRCGPALGRREVIGGILGLGLAGAARGLEREPVPRRLEPEDPERIPRENDRPGTTEWMLSNPRIDPPTRFRCPWIEGYCSHNSIRAGEALEIMVSTRPASRFHIDIYRLGYYGGAGGRHLRRLGPFEGEVQADPPVGDQRLRECTWSPCTSLRIPDDWVSGVYLGKLTAEAEGVDSYVVFIVRDRRAAEFNFQCSTHTWLAYNRWPDQFALYDDGENHWYWGPNVKVSYDRPYARYCQIFDAPLSTGSGEYLLWEFPLAYWMEQHGYDVTYTANTDTHTDAAGLRRCLGWLSVGHDEYWTLEMYRNVMAARDAGINLGFFSANTCYGVVDSLPGANGRPDRIITRAGLFRGENEENQGIDLPSQALLERHGPDEALLIGARSAPPVTGGGDWRCVKPEHWIFAGTGMKHGDAIPGLVGWEWHGEPADIPGLEVVAEGPTDNGRTKGHYTATIYPGPKDNFVFNAATIWWGDGLAAPPGYMRPKVYTEPQGVDPRVQRITRNILDRMRGR